MSLNKKISLKVITRAKEEGVEKISESAYKIKLFIAPEKGKANKRVLELLAEYLGVKKNRLKIISGQTYSNKVLEIIE